MVDLGDDNDNGQHADVTGDGSPGNPVRVHLHGVQEMTLTLDDTPAGYGRRCRDPAANGAAGDRLGGIENLTGSNAHGMTN